MWGLTSYRREIADVKAALDQSGRVVLSIPATLPKRTYSVEVVCEKDGYGRRSYEVPVFSVVESNGETHVTYDVVECQLSADIEMEFQLVPTAGMLGKNAYEMWKELPGNEGKTLQDYIDEVLDLNTITAACVAATEAAEEAASHVGHPDYNNLTNKPAIPTETTVSGWGFTKNTGTITGITMNGNSKGTSGVVDLGTVVTDVTGKEDKMSIDSTAKTASFTALVGKYYTVNVANNGSVAVTLPTSGFTTTDIQSIVFLVTLGSGTASCTFSPVAMTAEGTLDASSTYEVNALWNGTGWYISFVKLVAST